MASSIAAFAVIALAVVLMPGADTILVLRTSLRSGIRSGTITAMGIVCGPIIWGALAGVGVAVFLGRNALVYSLVTAAGGLYLGYLAYGSFITVRNIWQSAASKPTADEPPTKPPRSSASFFLTGLMTNLLNPKIGVFYVSIMPGLFMGQHVTLWLGVLLGAIHAVLGLAYLSAVAALSRIAGSYLTRPRVRTIIELACGLCLLGFGIFVVVEAVAHSRLLV